MHEWLLGSNTTVANERINLAWGEDTVGKDTLYRRFKKFDEGEEGLEDQPRSGRPKEVDRQDALASELSERDFLQLLHTQLDDQLLSDNLNAANLQTFFTFVELFEPPVHRTLAYCVFASSQIHAFVYHRCVKTQQPFVHDHQPNLLAC
ncbi:hypothetical protein KIN20_001421 [Parelaphostrongylus tenuis]|uniref:Uncharacterized protein n=1 Tax=Parelaphostrongylus tenuis TaxID=148309 RepID=A0AAD5LU27_PARTN|nr:hypothetical protein KIN20_001421 [Parelaphostrongylus tenuis]